jgi:glycosyltransferase involved in cell wall biosynthesis
MKSPARLGDGVEELKMTTRNLRPWGKNMTGSRDACDLRTGGAATAARLRIGFIGARGIGASYSGIETYYEEVGSRLVSYGHDVVVYCRRHFTPADCHKRGLRVVYQPCVQSKHGETLTHTLASTMDVLRRPFDIVQFHALGPALFAALPRFRGARTVASIRGLDWQREKWGPLARGFLRFCERASHRFPTAVSVVSKTLREHYAREYGVNVRYIPNGVTLEASPEPREINALGLEPRRFILFMGRISPEKGVDTLIEAYRRLGKQTRPVKLVIAGGSSYTGRFIDQLRAQAPDGVLFPGRVGGRLRAELYSHAGAFVLPSTIEGLSVALLEAMSFGACVVTSDIPENRELVDGVGLTVPCGDPAALAAALDRVLRAPEAAATMGRLARARVEAEYTWDAVARATEAFYRELTGGRRSEAAA